jgi:hypothetical protein
MKISIVDINWALSHLGRGHVDLVETLDADTGAYARDGSAPAVQRPFRTLTIQNALDGKAYLTIPESHFNGDLLREYEDLITDLLDGKQWYDLRGEGFTDEAARKAIITRDKAMEVIRSRTL